MTGSARKKKLKQLLAAAEEVDQAQQISRFNHRHKRRVSDLQAEVKDLNDHIDVLEDRIDTLEALKVKPQKLAPLRPVPRRSGKLPACHVALASDWHTCEHVSAKHTAGKNRHDQSIGEERAWRWADGMIKMAKNDMRTCDIKTVVIWLGGDFLVNDSLHYKSERSCDLSPADEARFIRNLLASILTHIRSSLDVDRIVIPTSWGNHDRSTPKMLAGLASDYSHIQPVYRDLQDWFSKEKSMEFRISESEWCELNAHGYPLLFHHGHSIRYGGGVGGLAVPLLRHVGRLRSDYSFRTLSVGHFHQRGIYQGGAAFSNGSLVGANGYSIALGLPSEPPSQVSFLIDLTRMEVANYYVIWGQ